MAKKVAKKRVEATPAQRAAALQEAGYMCANPRCRTILALDIHDIEWVTDDGPTEGANLIALCANCHRLHHRGDIPKDAIYAWKGILVALNQAFDREAIHNVPSINRVDK